MPTHISLVNWTDQGIRNIKESPERFDAFKKGVEAAGGKVIGFYLTMGRYDMVVITEGPSDEVAAALVLSTAKGGSIRTETMKAFPEDRYRDIISKVQ
ncbi:MAG: GYD family protein [Dehalococcoidia bacterium SG8_51_3]|nr:MAG: GYD family protein [Dehalococcoidia bacterium SG8_51_3]